jgi:predicted DNA-binding antitoxin AbrB/MazE fold protein
MLEIKVTYRNGVFVPDQRVELPEGIRGVVHLHEELPAFLQEDRPLTPDEITEWLQRMEALPTSTEAEIEDFEKALREVRDWFRHPPVAGPNSESGNGLPDTPPLAGRGGAVPAGEPV